MNKQNQDLEQAMANVSRLTTTMAEAARSFAMSARAMREAGEVMHLWFTEAEHKEAEEAGVPVMDYWARR